MSLPQPARLKAFGDIDPKEELLYALASHLLCVAAVWYGSHFALRRWITVQSLLPPEPIEPDGTSSKPSPPAIGPTGPVRRRFLNKRMFRAIGLAIALFAAEVGTVYALRRFASALILDIVFSVFEFVLITGVAGASIMVLWPFPSTIKYMQSTKSKAVILEYWTNTGKPIYVRATAVLFAAMVLSSSKIGKRVLQPAHIAAWALNVFGPIEHFRMTVKFALLIINGCVLGVGALTGLILGAMEVAKSFGFVGPQMPDGNVPSPWMNRVSMVCGMVLPTMISGIITAMALRYDFSKHGSPPALRHDPGEAVEIANQAPPFPKNTFTAAITALALSLTILDALTFLCPTPEFLEADHSSELLWIYVVVPTVTLATLYSTWRQGLLMDWWTYEERWWWTSSDSCQESLRLMMGDASTREQNQDEKSVLESL